MNRAELHQRWQALAERERRAVALAGGFVALLLLWLLGLQPALRTLKEAPAQINSVEAELQAMRALADETTRLRATAPVSTTQAVAALNAATERLGNQGRISIQGDRATLTLSSVDTESLRQWLELARSAARARPVEAQLSRGPTGYSGTLVVHIGGGA
jgi:general secretion pathway protein M